MPSRHCAPSSTRSAAWGVMVYVLLFIVHCLMFIVYHLVERLLRRNEKRFRGGLVFKAHILVYDSTLDSRIIKRERGSDRAGAVPIRHGAPSSTRSAAWGVMVYSSI